MSLKIQINSLEALERLIGGDNQVEMDIRQNIVEEFARKHLKAIVNSELMLKLSTALKKEIEEEFVNKSSSNWSGNYSLTTKARELLKEQIMLEKRVLVADLIAEHFTASGLEELIREKAKYVADELVEKVLNARFNDQVELEIKKRLGIK